MPKKELHFSIEGTTPHTFPMARLADYLRELATLFGNEDNVHFLRVDDGSANCAMEINAEIEPTVSERVRQAQNGLERSERFACTSMRTTLRPSWNGTKVKS